VATVGCNFRCSFCQNADISQMPRDDKHIEGQATAPEAIVQAAQRYRNSDCRSISYTYTEPTIFFEYAYAISQLAHHAGIANTWVTNGYMTAEMLDLVAPKGSRHQPAGVAPNMPQQDDKPSQPSGLDHPEPATSDLQPLLMDAANVDLKAFTDTFYRQQCGARLQPVLDNLIEMKRRGVWVEVTTLVIPGLNDSPQELADIAHFIATELGVETPWHVSRFHPTYRLTDRPPTPVSSVRRARDSGLAAGLRYVYEGNVSGGDGEDTCCPTCQRAIIRRMGFTVLENHVRGGACEYCEGPVDGVWS
jgi:pyruvate formate lyase activating enzyme